jgi:hypothetical protein
VGLLEVHDSVHVDSRDGFAVLVVRRVQVNEATIALICFALLGYVTFLVADSYVRYLIVAALMLLAAIAMARAFRIRVETSKEHVRVLNYWRTFEFAWNDVKDVGIGAVNQGPLPQPALAFGLHNGRIVCAQATPRNSGELQKLVRELISWAPDSVVWRPDLLSFS